MEYIRLTYEEILELGPRMSKYDFHKFICGRKVYSSICLKNKMKVQVKVIWRNKFMQLKMKDDYTYVRHENHEYLFTYQTGGVDSNEGILLSSIGSYSLTNLKYNIDYEMVKAINSVYQEGQSRKRCKKIGLATYRVARGTNRPHPRPTIRDEDIGKHQYYNEKSNQSHIKQLETESIAQSLGENAIAFGKSEHKPLYEIIGSSCDMMILTSGIPNYRSVPSFSDNSEYEKKNSKCYISFACTVHRDDCDTLRGHTKRHFDNKCKDHKYMEEFITMLGSGMPTTCQYKHVWKSTDLQDIYKIIGYFHHDELGIMNVIVDRRSCTFLGFAYAHSTPICYLEKNNCSIYDEYGIVFMNDPDIFSMFAWGSSGGPKEYARNNNIW